MTDPSRTLVELEMTCGACPSQWEGRLADGRHVYARYRWGALRVSAGDTIDAAIGGDSHNSEELFFDQLGDGLDGVLDEYTMLSKAGLEFRPDTGNR